MSEHDLDLTYTALSQALAKAGEDKAGLLLSTLSLALIARQAAAADVLPLIEDALRLSQC